MERATTQIVSCGNTLTCSVVYHCIMTAPEVPDTYGSKTIMCLALYLVRQRCSATLYRNEISWLLLIKYSVTSYLEYCESDADFS
jgi:hypothetical protein